MLVLTRRLDESIVIGEDIEIKVLKIAGNQVHLGIEAPRHVTLYRKEVYERVVTENQRALKTGDEPLPASLGQLQSLFQSAANRQPSPNGRS